jgi:hypothetical protein
MLRRLTSHLSRVSIVEWISYAALATYLYLFLWGDSPVATGLAPYWFNPLWATDDSVQQTYPFIRALHPGAFDNDFVTRMMINYIPPMHYWLGYTITLVTHDAIMTGHWIMLIQLCLAVFFIFGTVRYLTRHSTPAVFAVIWFLHTRHIIQRITAGLPRGWAAPIIAAFFYFATRGNHRGVLATIAVGCLIHPPSTLAVSVAYGLYLLFQIARKESRRAFLRPCIQFVVLTPIFFAITAWAVAKPTEFGSMTTYQEALSRPEFSSREPRGRFTFVPFKPVYSEVSSFAFQAFTTPRFTRPAYFMKYYTPWIVGALALSLFWVGRRRRVIAFPHIFVAYGIASAIVYAASRILAFKLFVPDRHLQFPFAILFILAFSVAVWRIAARSDDDTGLGTPTPQSHGYRGALLLMMLGVIIYAGSGTGLYGAANFNYHKYKRGKVFEWIKNNTPLDAVVAGEPIFIDPVQLFGERRGYITSETAHPFYTGYWQEARRRLEVSLRANYARTSEEFLSSLSAEGISHFVFDRESLRGDRLKKAKYYAPFDRLVPELASHEPSEYLLRKLLNLPKEQLRSFVVYIDNRAVVVDLEAFRRAGIVVR